MRTPHRNARRLSTTVAAVAVLVALVSGCIPPYQGNPNGPRVAIVGDSVTGDSTRALHLALDRDYLVSVDGLPSATIDQRYDTNAEFFAQEDLPDIVVVALGTNDAQNFGHDKPLPLPQPAFNDSLYASSVAAWRMLDVAKSARCIVLVDVNSHTGRPWLNEWAAAWNSVFLPAFASVYPQVRIAHWDQQVGYFGWGITYDSIHPNDWGQLIFAVTVANAVKTCP